MARGNRAPAPSSLFPLGENGNGAGRRKREATPEAKALEANVRAFLDSFATEYLRVTGRKPTHGIREVQLVRRLVRTHGRERVELAATALLDRHEAGRLAWRGEAKAPTIATLNAMMDDLLEEADRATR